MLQHNKFQHFTSESTQVPTDACARVGRPAEPAAVRRWTINGDFLSLHPAGVPRYAREVTRALDRLFDEGHPLTRGLECDLVASRAPGDDDVLRCLPIRVVPEYNRPRLPQVWVQLQLPRHVPGGLLSFCNLAPVSIRRQIVCIHDLQTRLVPASYGLGFRLAHRLILPMLGRRAAAITTVSHRSADDIARLQVAAAAKVTVTGNGCDHALRWQPDRVTQPVGGTRPYVFCIGRTMLHKNLDLLLRLAAPLDAIGIDLVMAGEVTAEDIAARGYSSATNLHRVGAISDDELAAALNGALCFAFPSRSEGFGLPAVEAMALGCPVISSPAPSLPEVCGDAALYAGVDDVPAWIATIDSLRSNTVLRQDLIARGRSGPSASRGAPSPKPTWG